MYVYIYIYIHIYKYIYILHKHTFAWGIIYSHKYTHIAYNLEQL